MNRLRVLTFWVIIALILNSCTTTGPLGLFGKKSPHEQYGQSLINAGLSKTSLGKSWFTTAEKSLTDPLTVTVPYKETGYFAAEKVRAISVRFEAKRGEKISIQLEKRPSKDFSIFVDLWEAKSKGNKKLVAFADTSGNKFSYDIDDSGAYIIRLQPELLSSGEYTLTITGGPSLAFPVRNGKIGSFWGADREGGVRRHEGIDIFAPKRTPALAATDGTVGRVTINQLGGKVVFLKPNDKNYSLYYAHLDEQLVSAGQKVKTGDTIGLVGNTGNAISTSPHLHFGIYTFSGAIDPLAFVNPDQKPVPAIKSPLSNIGKLVRTQGSPTPVRSGANANTETITTLALNTPVEVNSATENYYRVELPDGSEGFVTSKSVTPTTQPFRQMKLTLPKPLFDHPADTAARKKILNEGSTVGILGNFKDYYFVRVNEDSGWIAKD